MTRLVSVAVMALCVTASFADKAPVSKALTPEEKAAKLAEFQARLRLATEKKTGGVLRKPNSAKGTFVVLNAQKAVALSDLVPITATLDRWIHVNTVIKPTETAVTVANIKGCITAAGGTVGVALIESDELPSFLAAPENGWVIVNVKPLVKGVSSNVAAARVRKEALRAYAFVVGGIYSGRGTILMREVKDPSDLDSIPREMFAIDVMAHMSKSSAHFGITPWYQTTYRNACSEGWAPQPTNEYQKAIWDKVHQAPTAPIVIKPEPKKAK